MDNIKDEENFYNEIDKDVESSDRPEDILVAHNSGITCTGAESSNEVLNIVTEVGDNNIPHNNAISVQHIVEPVSELSVDNTSEASVPILLPEVVAEAVPVDSLAENSRIEVDIAVEQEVKTHVEQTNHAMSSDKPELESSVGNADQEGEAVRQGQPPSQSSPHNEVVTGPDNAPSVSEIAKQHADTVEQVAVQHTELLRDEKESLRAAKREEEAVEKQAKKDPKKHINAAMERIKKGKPAVKGESDQKGEVAAASDLAFLPTIQQKAGHAHRVRSLVKDRREAEASGESNWDDSLSSVRQAEKQRYEAVDQRRRDRLEARAQRLPGDGGEDSASVDSQTAAMDGSKVAAFQLSAPHKPAARSRSYQTHRRNREPAAAVAEDGAGRILLPPLVAQRQPHSSPHPRAALSSLLQESDGLSAMGGSGKPRKNRKPLYLRMIERAQQQYVEDEKNKHESYMQQKKLRQRNNPTQEELREHRRKHDELVLAKLEEGKRQLAEQAAANARAVRRQQAAASAVQTALEEGVGSPQLVVDGASPNKKRRAKKSEETRCRAGATAAKDSLVSLPALNADGTGGPGSSNAENHGFSPVKGSKHAPAQEGEEVQEETAANEEAAYDQADVDIGNATETAATTLSFNLDATEPIEPAVPEISNEEPQHVALAFDLEAATAAVERIPSLSADSVSSYCAADWLGRLSAQEAELGGAGDLALSQPNPDAQKLMSVSAVDST